jgi:hypothetical protein
VISLKDADTMENVAENRIHNRPACLMLLILQLPLKKIVDESLLSRYLALGHSKGKAIPLQAWRGPEGSGRVRFPDFKTIGT